MADTHEERLLNSLLQDMRAADEGRSVPELEARVLAAWDARRSRQSVGRRRLLVIASAAAAMLLTYLGVPTVRVDDAGPLPSVHAAPRLAAASPIAPVGVPSELPQVPLRAVARQAAAEGPLEFVPLMPLTRQELSGPFQLVHVQLPRASLGAMAPPHQFPGQLVEADVLLGEDGMARAIRVSSNGSVTTPWRSR